MSTNRRRLLNCHAQSILKVARSCSSLAQFLHKHIDELFFNCRFLLMCIYHIHVVIFCLVICENIAPVATIWTIPHILCAKPPHYSSFMLDCLMSIYRSVTLYFWWVTRTRLFEEGGDYVTNVASPHPHPLIFLLVWPNRHWCCKF